MLKVPKDFAFAPCIVALQDAPMGGEREVYLLHEQSDHWVGWRLDQPVRDKLPNTKLTRLHDWGWNHRLLWEHVNLEGTTDPVGHWGGREQATPALLHDDRCSVDKSRTIAFPFACITTEDEFEAANWHIRPPYFSKLLYGHEIFAQEELSSKFQSKKWILCNCPFQVLYGKNDVQLSAMALHYQKNVDQSAEFHWAESYTIADPKFHEGMNIAEALFNYVKLLKLTEARHTFALHLKKTHSVRAAVIDRYLDTLLHLDKEDRTSLLHTASALWPDIAQEQDYPADLPFQFGWDVVQVSERIGAELRDLQLERYAYDAYLTRRIFYELIWPSDKASDDSSLRESRRVEDQFDQLFEAVKGQEA